MKKIILFALLLLPFFAVKAQIKIQVSGVVKDSTDEAVISAAVRLESTKDTVNTITNLDGVFVFGNIKSSEFVLTITALGYKPVKKRYFNDAKATQIILDPIIMGKDSRVLNEVVVNGTLDVVIKEDTLEYNAGQYKLKENAVAEDLLKKLPGIEVDRDGNVTAQGKAITKIRVNGKDYFGGDVKTATQQLPANIIEKVQIIDDYGDQANITGVRDGEADKILNFTVRKDKNKGYLARGIVGGGDQDRYQGSLFAATFDNDQQLAVLGNFNNTNANVFSLTQGAVGGGGGGRGGPGGGGGASNGLTGVNSVGFNYRDSWGKKITAYGSYSYNGRNNITTSSNLQDLLNGGNTISNNTFDNSDNTNNNHRFNFNFEYKIDSLNYLKIIPNVNFTNSDATTLSRFTTERSNIPSSSNNGNSSFVNEFSNPNYGGEILYNHRFGAKARNFSINANFNSTSNSQNQDYIYSLFNTQTSQLERYQYQIINGENQNDNVRIRTSYTEPISKTKNLEFNYAYSFARTDNDRRVDNSASSTQAPVFDQSLSNAYVFDFVTNRFGFNYRVNEKKYEYNAGFSVQPTSLTGTGGTNRQVTNLFPTGRFSYKFSRTRQISINYNGQANQPGYTQLQPITDKTNVQFYVTGNPQLNPEFTNSINLRYNNFDFASGNTVFTNVSYSFTKDKIVTNIITNPIANDRTVLQETLYTNASGFYTVNGFYAFSKPFAEKKYVVGLRGSAFYNNNISLINDLENTGKNLILSQRLNVQINPVEWLELVPAATYTYNKNDNTLNTRANAKVNTISTSFDSKIYFAKTWIFSTSFDKSFNSGFNAINVNPFIINTYLEKQFFEGKKGSLKLQAFDLLNESTALSFNATGNSTTLSQSNRLARYFMLSFSFNISKFAGGDVKTPDFGGGENRYRRSDN